MKKQSLEELKTKTKEISKEQQTKVKGGQIILPDMEGF